MDPVTTTATLVELGNTSAISVIVKRVKATLKSILMDAYCRRLIPGWLVTAAFRVLQLASA
jgi:hypothetical protein